VRCSPTSQSLVRISTSLSRISTLVCRSTAAMCQVSAVDAGDRSVAGRGLGIADVT
jgi:hypothetical protein